VQTWFCTSVNRTHVPTLGCVADPAENLTSRLTASADRLAQLREEAGAEEQRRDDLVIELRDSGRSWRAVAAAARLSISRCVAIVTGHT
jgi:hypothetical protein